MDNNIKSNTSFWREITEYKIQVPYYQRDYAQGRKDGGRIDNIREVFVEELYGALKGQKICHLGLVFGSYNENEKVFVAVDGQQRLTTVFLLHWYVAWRENKLNEYKGKLLNFSWDTRSYSSQFVELLFEIHPSNNVIDAIKTNSSYFSVWENDPTVNGMLTMLEEIEYQYPQNDCDLCNSLFADNCKIQYDILKLEKGSDGKTYLKMNSRGRSLTTFELFKSKFLDNYRPIFDKKFDNKWLNFMLKCSEKGSGVFSDPDISYMNFINEYTYMVLHFKEECNAEDHKGFIEAKVKGNRIDTPFISFEKYKPAFDNNIECFEKFFDWIIENYDTIKTIDDKFRFPKDVFFIEEIINSNNPDFSHRAKLFSLFKYAKLTEYIIIDVKQYRKWNRVFRNLVANTDIGSSKYKDICQAIDAINNPDIYEYLSNDGALKSFDTEQIQEEIAKAKQILDEDGNFRQYEGIHRKEDDSAYRTWEEIISKAEQSAFFKGAIRFLFTKESIGDDWGHFDPKWDNARTYFDECGVKDKKNSLLLRRLISLFTNWDDFKEIYYNNESYNWREWILLNKKLNKYVDVLLRNNPYEKRNFVEDFHSAFDGIEKKRFQEKLVKTSALEHIINLDPNGFVQANDFYLKIEDGFKSRSADFVFRIDFLNDIFWNREELFTSQKIEGFNLLNSWDIDFSFLKKYFFRYYRHNNTVCLMKKDWKDKIHKNEEDNLDDPENSFYFYVEETMDENTFLEKLKETIRAAKDEGSLC